MNPSLRSKLREDLRADAARLTALADRHDVRVGGRGYELLGQVVGELAGLELWHALRVHADRDPQPGMRRVPPR